MEKNVRTSLKRSKFLSGAIALSFATSSLAASFGGLRRQPPSRPQRPQPTRPAPVVETEFTEVKYIGKEIKGTGKIFLGNELRLFKDHKGKEIKSVKIELNGLNKGGSARLLVNGSKVGQVKKFSRGRVAQNKVKWSTGNKTFILGQDVRSLQVEFKGQAFVMEATVELVEKSRPFPPRPTRPARPLIVDVNYDFYGQGSISLASLISANYNQYTRPTSSVALVTDGPSFRGMAQLCVAARQWDCGALRTVSYGRAHLTLNAPSGSHKLGDLIVKTRGQFSIKQVVLHPQR